MSKSTNWIGPVIGAVILIGGYVAYDNWKETNREDKECAALKQSFESNMNSMMGSVDSSITESDRVGNQMPMGSLAANVAANQAVLDTLNVRCPGWQEKQYRN